jgi:hypothetical protein
MDKIIALSNYLMSLSGQLFPGEPAQQAVFEESVLQGDVSILIQGSKQTTVIFHTDENFFKYIEANKIKNGFFNGELKGWIVRLETREAEHV